MVTSSNRGLRMRSFREQLHRLRQKYRFAPDATTERWHSEDGASSDLSANQGLNSAAVAANATALIAVEAAHDAEQSSSGNGNGHAQPETSRTALVIRDAQQSSSIKASSQAVASDLWSAAYREAVERLGEDLDVAILQGQNAAQLFKELEDIDKDATQESAFLRGVEYLRSIQVPLERFKLALDLATPLTSIEPTTSTVFGVVRSVSAIAISLATADLNFAKQIGQMLEHISYIDDCDTLGQKINKKDIHDALVSVYQKLLEFYKAAFEILTRKGVTLMVKMALETDVLPGIVQEFLGHADMLRKLVQKATLEIVEDIRSMLYDREIASWLGSSRMMQQSQYHASLQEHRSDLACEYLLEDPSFLHWYRAATSQRLAVLGPMGYGKSVSMGFLIDTLIQRNEHQLPKPKLCYYYCRNDETGQTAHILSALILSLLEQLLGLKKTFYEWYKQTQASGYYDPANNAQKLEEFLNHIVDTLDRPLFLVIDGLDECDRVSRSRLLKYLETLSRRTPGLKTLLASRSETDIIREINTPHRIELGADDKRDRFIIHKLVHTKLSYLEEDVKALVVQTLSPLAQGSAIWSRMIIELIELKGIRALGPMRRFLEKESLPTKLGQLYATLFVRSTSDDGENMRLANTAFLLLAISRRPLSMLELSWAVTLATAQEHVASVAALGLMVDSERIMGLVHPFVGPVDYKDPKKRQVQLVHQSAKEFVIERANWNQPHLLPLEASVETDTPFLFNDGRKQALETNMLNLCMDYLLLEEVSANTLFTEEQEAIQELPQEVDLFDDREIDPEYTTQCTWDAWEEDMITYDPVERGFGEFFVYAANYWIGHFSTIKADPLPPLASVESLCAPGSRRLSNWIEQERRPGCRLQPRYEFDAALYDPLSITSLWGSEAMLRHMLQNSDLESNKFHPQTVYKAVDQVLQWGETSRLSVLYKECPDACRPQCLDIVRLTMQSWFYPREPCQSYEGAFDFIEMILEDLSRAQLGNGIFCAAARLGCIPLVQRLMARTRADKALRDEVLGDVQRNAFQFWSDPVHQSVGEAVWMDQLEMVRYLLCQDGIGPHLCHVNSSGENVLHIAAKLCNPAMFELLVSAFREGVQHKDKEGCTPLERVVRAFEIPSQKRYESVKILVMEGGAGDSLTNRIDQQNCMWLAHLYSDDDLMLAVARCFEG